MKIIYCLSAVLSLSILGCTAENPRVTTKLNDAASLTGELPSNPLQRKVISSWIDKQNSTMSTLFGNEVAVQYARANLQHDYPSGSVLSVVTWNQQEDARWFGGKMPATTKSVEFVVVGTTPDHHPSYSYQNYEGSPLKKISAQDGPAPNDRAAYLLAQRAAVMP
jgi:hypothetical protein